MFTKVTLRRAVLRLKGHRKPNVLRAFCTYFDFNDFFAGKLVLKFFFSAINFGGVSFILRVGSAHR